VIRHRWEPPTLERPRGEGVREIPHTPGEPPHVQWSLNDDRAAHERMDAAWKAYARQHHSHRQPLGPRALLLRTLRRTRPEITHRHRPLVRWDAGAELAATSPERVGKLVLVTPIGLSRDDAPVRNWMIIMPRRICRNTCWRIRPDRSPSKCSACLLTPRRIPTT